MPLYTAFRQALGDRRALRDAPGHVVESDDADHGLTVVIVAILFLWDAWILTESGAALFLSHDEWGLVLSRDGEWVASAHEMLTAFSESAA
jgi:hypothetical protein